MRIPGSRSSIACDIWQQCLSFEDAKEHVVSHSETASTPATPDIASQDSGDTSAVAAASRAPDCHLPGRLFSTGCWSRRRSGSHRGLAGTAAAARFEASVRRATCSQLLKGLKLRLLVGSQMDGFTCVAQGRLVKDGQGRGF